MDHNFIPATDNPDICAICRHLPVYHGDDAICESCERTGPVEEYRGMFLCKSCLAKELSLLSLPNDPVPKVKIDIFNSTMQSIAELKIAIDANPHIPDKAAHLAEKLLDRYRQLQDAIFKIDQEKLELLNQQKAIQVYLNDLASKLRQEERERLQLQNINYKPPVKIKAKPTAKARPKIDKAEIRKLAAELGVAEYTLRSVMIAKNLDAQSAANLLRRTIAEGKSEND